MRSLLRLSVAATVLAVAAVDAGFGQSDHLKCYKVKDSAAKVSYTATLTPPGAPFTTETGCVVKVPAKLLCSGVAKSDVQPTPPGGVAGLPLGSELFACYKLKCPKNPSTFDVADQFGTRSMTIKAPNMLCAPAHVPLGTCESSAPPTCGGTCPVNCFCMTFGGSCTCFC